MTTKGAKTPIERVLDLLPDAKGPNVNGFYQAHCPAHNDGERSLSFKAIGEGKNEGVYFHCFAFCTREAILSALNITEDEMRTTRSTNIHQSASLTLIDLAIDKRLH